MKNFCTEKTTQKSGIKAPREHSFSVKKYIVNGSCFAPKNLRSGGLKVPKKIMTSSYPYAVGGKSSLKKFVN